MYSFGIVKTSATSQWAFDPENNDMTAVTKKPQDARELKVHSAGDGDSLVQLTFCQKNTILRLIDVLHTGACSNPWYS